MGLEHSLVQAVRKAGTYIREHSFETLDVQMKRFDDPVTQLDKGTERHLKKVLTPLHVTQQVSTS